MGLPLRPMRFKCRMVALAKCQCQYPPTLLTHIQVESLTQERLSNQTRKEKPLSARRLEKGNPRRKKSILLTSLTFKSKAIIHIFFKCEVFKD